MTTILSSKGQIVLPASLRERDLLPVGQMFEIERIEAGAYLLKKQSGVSGSGVVDWLLGCPQKDWFQPIPSESTDSL